MKFIDFATYLEKIESITGRNEMTEIIAELIKKLNKEEIDKALYLFQGRVAPKYVSLEFNFGPKLLIKAIAKAFSKGEGTVKSELKKIGDPGQLIFNYNSNITDNFDILFVYKELLGFAGISGKDSQLTKIEKLSSLFKRSSKISSKFITRIVLGNLRIGVSDKTILDALSIFLSGNKALRSKLDDSYGVMVDIGLLAKAVKENGEQALNKIQLTVGVPVLSMLCERENDFNSVLKRGKKWIVQPKFDGLRCQIHFKKSGFDNAIDDKNMLIKAKKSKIKLFSRNLEDITSMFPEIENAIAVSGINEIVLDSEVCGIGKDSQQLLNFQSTIQRKRKYDIKETSKRIPINVFAFDLLKLNDDEVYKKPLEERINLLKNLFSKNSLIVVADSIIASKLDDFENFFHSQVKSGLEGVVIKNPNSVYEFGKRGFNWIKYKKSSKGFVVDTVDAVVLGYYKGSGQRSKFGIGALLLGIYNESDDSFLTLSKVGTGIKDDDFKKIKKRLDEIKIEKKPDNYYIEKSLLPDVFVLPKVVCEIESDEITRSVNHSSGFSLRFPRLKRFDRDKDYTKTESLKTLERMFKLKTT